VGLTLDTSERGALDCKDDGIDNAIGAELLDIHRPPLSERRCDEINTEFNKFVAAAGGANEHSKVKIAAGWLENKGTQFKEVDESKP